MEFRTSSYRSGLVGLVIAAGLLAVAVGLGSWLVLRGGLSLHRPLSPLTLGLCLVLLFDLLALVSVVYWSVAALRLRYVLNRNGLVIHWGASKLIVPIQRIRSIVAGSQLEAGRVENFKWSAFWGIGWAGLRVGRARFPSDRLARVFTTSPLEQSAVVLTPDKAYILSPDDVQAFIHAWQVRRPLGPTQNWQEQEVRARLLDLFIWRDWLAWTLIACSLLANLALQVYLSLVFDKLPDMLALHFNAFGQADHIASRTQILRLPQVALLVLVLDLGLGFVVYGRQRVAAYLIWGAGLVLQLLAWVAVLTII